ncbi:MAG TPA: HigA family addiction module antitoxin [Terriglobia bacterium]
MPRTAIHPGEHLADAVRALGITAAQLARDIQVPPNRVTGILHGARAITADTALRLARYFGTSAEFWMNLQQHYDLRLAEKEMGAGIKSIPRRKARSGHGIHSPAA